MGAVSTYDEAVAKAICERIAEGEPLRQICRDEGMPAWRTVYDWMEKHEDFAASIACARKLGFDAIAEDAIQIAEDGTNDYVEKAGRDGLITVFDSEHVQRSKLRIETRLKLLAKWDPSRYGDRMTLAGDAKNPLAVSVELSTSTTLKDAIRGGK